MMKKPSVTTHALLRWLERAKGVDVKGFRRDLAAIEDRPVEGVADSHLLQWILAAYEWDERAIIREILTPECVAAFNAGCSGFKTRGLKICFRNDAVVSVTPGLDKPKVERPGGLNSREQNKARRRARKAWK